VGHVSRRVRTDLVRLYIVAEQLDEEGIVDQLMQMGICSTILDRAGLQRDISRLLRKYHGMPLGAIRAHELIEDIMPVAFSYNLHFPSDLWLLGKTLAMMEGVGLKLVPEFDIFAVSEPYVRRFVRQMASPSTWGPQLAKGASDWAALIGLIPRVGTQVLTRVERGEMEIILNHKGLNQALGRMDRLANRVSLSILLAALIMGLAMLIPILNTGEQWNLATIVVITGFASASLLALWLIISIWRSTRKQ